MLCALDIIGGNYKLNCLNSGCILPSFLPFMLFELLLHKFRDCNRNLKISKALLKS